ncbi:TRAP transporter small permease [Acuticoccus sp. M5D2P5]|uniref:TRAP transporter small permease n=1 Tax=Acuticoccus kalidii TaxID=2910977 RepID=UPI001F3B42F0|nr:TRAP transporter small permease [Acuticoccus kalidii]MCF3933411.1 TRAP transporter small permease [Acuticoccus kalidii]
MRDDEGERSAGFGDAIEGAAGEAEAPFPMRFEDGPAVVLFWATAVVIFLQFFTRYVLNNSFGWTEEVARYLLIGVTFIGASAVLSRRSHINMTYFADRLPAPLRRVVAILADVVATAIFAALTYYAARVSELMGNQPMASIDLPMGVVYWVVTAGFAAMTLRSLQNLVTLLRSKPA